jgi:NADPH:quinone reductase
MTGMEMRAARILQPGGVEVLQVQTFAKPQPGVCDVLVRVHASALNRADILQRRGKYPAPRGVHPDIPGMEFAGEVEACGSLVSLWKAGDRVMGLVGGGAHAEYVVAHERTLAEIPSHLSWEEAAAIPEAFITAHDALWIQAGLRPNERVLIHAVGSGVGLAATQIAHAMNALSSGTSRTADKLQRARAYGLDSGFAISGNPTAEDGQQWAAGGAFDVVLDLVGGPYTNASLHALAPKGRIILIGTMGGARGELDLSLMLGRRARLVGTVLRSRPLEEKISVTLSFAREVLPLFARGILRPVIDSVFDLSDIGQAHDRMESNETFGKVILRVAKP